MGKRGGFGEVFLDRSSTLTDLAIKRLFISSAEANHRELRIAEELSGRNFRNVIPFIDSGVDAESDEYFIVMPRAEKSLQDLVDAGPLSTSADTAAIMLQILEGLLEVDGLVHRDLKPANVLLHEGTWKVADFGIARFVAEATSDNTRKGYLSEQYAAPEQWRQETATHATDAYALGCIGYCLLSGQPPFIQNPQLEHQNSSVPPLNCSDPRLPSLIYMMLRKPSTVRPGLSRIHQVLSQIVNSPARPSHHRFTALATASAHVAEAQQRKEAEQHAAKYAKQLRDSMVPVAIQGLRENFERFWLKISAMAPSAERLSPNQAGENYYFTLGQGTIVAYVPTPQEAFPANLFPNRGWDLITQAHIFLDDRDTRTWGSTLYYAKLSNSEDYRWYEISLFQPESSVYPMSLQNPRVVDMSASHPNQTGVDLAFGPVAIDDENEEDFHERWGILLALASRNTLEPPSLPIKVWPSFE